MKLHLPLRLFRAVVALMITATTTTIAAEIPSDYTIFTAASYGDVTARMGNSSDIAFLVENNLTFTKLTVMPSNNNYSRFFISADENNPKSIAFSDDCYLEVSDEEVLIFDKLNTLTFDNNTANQFSLIEGISEKGYLGGAIVAKGSAEICISNTQSVFFDNNMALYDRGYASYGAAIYNYNGKITIFNNDDLTFYNNIAVNSSSFSHACGGAIYSYGGEITLNNNKSITFESNAAVTSTTYSQTAGSVIAVFYPSYNAFGGAIHNNSGTISLLHNDTIIFKNNYSSQSCPLNASSSLGAPSYGGAIYNNAGSISIDFNKSVDFLYNRVDSSVNFAYGGAIYSNSGSISLNNNDFLTFRENVSTSSNSSSKGGAIFNNNSCISINENGIVSFSKNMAAVYNTGDNAKGGAIYGSTVKICDNQNVIFEQNYERIATGSSLSPYTYRLRSLYATGDVSLSAANGNFIEFRDSIYIGGSLTINSPYTDSNDNTATQLGDIIFTGAYTATHLKEIKGTTATDSEIANSQTSQINNMIDLYGGSLQVIDGAKLNGRGLTLASGSNAKLLMRDSSMNHSGYYLTFNDNTSLELQGENNITASQLIFQSNSALAINISEKNVDTVSLTLSGTLNLKGVLTLTIEGDNLTANTSYQLLKAGAYDSTQWIKEAIDVVGINETYVSFDDLYWENNVLWLAYKGIPALTIATWCNESGDGMWNINSANWEQGDFHYAYIDGVDVVFGDKGAGNVRLEGVLSPKSVLVNNSVGHDYSWTGSGCLAGNTTLTKQGEGTLTINTANSYTGGTSITGGTLKVGHVQALGIGAVAINGGTIEIGVIDFKNTITTSGNSTIIISNGFTHNINEVIQNNGSLTLQGNFNADALSPTGTIAATRIDLNGNKGESGFVQTAGFTLQLVNGGTVNDDAASITYNGKTITLDNNGIATVEGEILYNQYHIASGHIAGVKEIAQQASVHGSPLSGISLASGGILNANASANVTATGGSINLTEGTISGSFSNVCITATQGMIAGSFSGNSTLVGNDYTLYSPLQNMGTLTLQGNFNADALTPNGTIAATRVDLNGNKGESGFVQTAGFTLQVVNGGTVNDDDAIITYNGNSITLDNKGIATVEGGILYNQYHIASGHTAGVKEIAQQASVHDSTLGGISLSAGGILNADASANVTATGGTINLTDGTISGNFNNVSMTATQGIIAGSFSGDSSLIGNNHVLFSTLQNNGTLTLKGHFIADELDKILAGEDVLVDINGNEGGCSGFQRTGDYTVFVADGNVISNEATVTYAGQTLAMTGGIGFGKGTIDYTHYLLSGNDKAAVSDIKDASGERLQNITLTNGQLTVDENANVNATGGTITITGNSILSGNIVNSHISTAAGNYNSTISATLGGEGTLTIGGGTITVTGDNTYSGGTTINDGRLEVGHKNALGTGDVNLNGGTLDLNSYPVENDITATGGTLEGGDTYEGKLTVNGHVTLGGHTTASGGIEINGGSISGGYIIDTDILVDGTGDMEISSTITGDSSLILNNGNLTINGSDNNYTGGTTINGGNLIIGNGTALGSGDITLNGGSLNTNGNEITNNIVNNGGTIITSYVLREGRTLTIGKGGMHMVGNLTLAGGNLLFNGMTLTVDGKVVAEAPVQVTVCGYSVIDMEDTVRLADFGSNVNGVNVNSFANTGYGTLCYDDAQNTLSITLTNKNAWIGGKGTTWIQGTNVGWADGKTFVSGNRALFTTAGTITITGAVEPASALVDIEKSLTFKTTYDKKVGVYSGYIMGNGCIVKRGKGTLTMNDGNTYSGGTFIEAGTVKAKGIASFGTGAVTMLGGTLNLAGKAIANELTLEGSASIKSGKKFTGDFTMSHGELLKGSALNIAETATLQSGLINGTLSGVGTVQVKGEVTLGTTGKITTNGLGIDGALIVSAKGLVMNTKASAITVNEGGSLISSGAIKACSMEINGGTVAIEPIKASSVTLTDSLHLNNMAMMNLNGKLSAKGNVTIEGESKLILSGALSAKNLTLGSGDIYITSTKQQTIKVSNELTLNGGTDLNFGFSVTQKDVDKNKTFKILTFKVLDTAIEASDLYSLLGLSEDICTLDFDKSRKSITLVVEDYEEWNKQAEAVRNGEFATAAADEAEDMLFAPATTAEAMAPELKKAADTLVQSTWGTVGASRAFSDTIANRGTHATQLEGGKGAAWISTMGGSSRISSEAGHAGADYTLTGAAFGIEAHLSADSTLGIAIGNSWGKVSTFSAYPVDQDSTHAGIYGNHKLGDTLSLSWMAAHTRTESDVNLAGLPCTWSQDALQLDARLTWAKALNARTSVNAFGGLQYLATDSGECNGIKTGSLQNLRAEIGVGATHRFTGDTMAYGELSFIGDVVRNNPTADLGGLRSRGTTPGRAGLNLSVGASHRLNHDWSVNATYNLELMQNITGHSLNVGATYSF